MSHNDITGDRLVSRTLSEQGRETFDAIFNAKPACGTCRKWKGSAYHRSGECLLEGSIKIIKRRDECCGEWEKR